MATNDYLPSDFEPHNLTKAQKEDPYLLIGEFFEPASDKKSPVGMATDNRL